jgi:hypothetical protein
VRGPPTKTCAGLVPSTRTEGLIRFAVAMPGSVMGTEVSMAQILVGASVYYVAAQTDNGHGYVTRVTAPASTASSSRWSARG